MSQKIQFAGSSVCRGLVGLCLSFAVGCFGSSGGTDTPSSSGGAGSGGSSASGGNAGSGGSGGRNAGGVTGGSTGGSSSAGTTSGGASGGAGSGGQTGGAGAGGSGGQTGGQTGGVVGSGGTGGSATTGGVGGGGTTGGTGGSASGGSGGTTSAGGAKPSEGCGKAPATLKSATPGQSSPTNSVSGRQFLVRWPSNYKNDTPYRLHIGLHGYGGNLDENGRDNFGLWSLSKDSTIFITLAANGGAWDMTGDLAYADAVLKKVESELCIDTSRVMLEGFSQGGAMAWSLTCSHPGVFRAVVGHSAGSPGFSTPTTCTPVAYLGSLGLSDVGGNSQATQTDLFAKADGCTIENLPTAPKGGHICTPYKGCKEGFPVTWCSYDGGHGFQATDSGQSSTWVPAAVWSFLSPL